MSQINFRNSLAQGFTAHNPENFEEINFYLFDLNMFSQIFPGITEQLEWSITEDGMYYFVELTSFPSADNPNINQHLASIREFTSNFLLVYLQKTLIYDELIPYDSHVAQIYNAAIDRIRSLITVYAPGYVAIEKAALVAEDNRLSVELSEFYQEQEEQPEEPTPPTFGLMLSSSSE